MSIRARSVVAALAVGLAVVACGDDGSGSSSEDAAVTTAAPSDEPTETAAEVTVPDCPPPELVATEAIQECELPIEAFDEEADPDDRIAALAATAREHGYDETADALDDGELTVAERRQAYQDALDCMTEQGAEVVQFEEYEGLYGTEFTFIVGKGILSDAELSVISTECEDRYTSLSKRADDILTGERFTDRAKEILQDCLATYGVTDDVGDTLDELREVVPSQEAELDCVDQAEEKPPPPDLPPPGG